MSLPLGGRSALLTGASSGIGATTAVALARRGTRLALVARREDRLAEVARECTRQGALAVMVLTADLSDLDTAESLAREVDDRMGGLDVLINNAGRPMRRRVLSLTPTEVEETMALNYFAPVRMSLAVLPGMVQRGRGSIVNVASVGGRFPIMGEAAYCGSKGALCSFTETLAVELLGTGVDSRLILPGPIDTEIWDQPGQDAAFYDGALEAPAAVADGIVAAIEGDRIEHWLPDLEAIARIKYDDLDAFVEAMANQTGGPDPRTPQERPA